MGRRLLVVAVCALVCAGSAASATRADWTKTDGFVAASDGTKLATTLYVPTGTPPAGGWPAVIMFHGLGGTRASMNTLAEQGGFAKNYVVLTTDHRGHGESGGLFDADGPREIQDARDLYDWLAARPGVNAKKIGAWGISLGGGVVWGALAAGVPFAAAEVYESWVDLYEALAPNNLSKSGAVFGFVNSVPADRTDPELKALQADALNSTNLGALKAFAAARSVKSALGRITTPVYVFQGRRDFAFGLEQGLAAYRGLAGPKRLYVGDFGHSPSTFPGPDIAAVLSAGLEWFSQYLGDKPPAIEPMPVSLATDPWKSSMAGYPAGPPTTTVVAKSARTTRTFGARGKAVFSFSLPKRKLETFGAPVVTVTASSKTQAKQLVAVVEAVAPGGASTIVSEGGTILPSSRKSWTLSFPLVYDTALIAPGSKLRLTLGFTTTAQSAANILYLNGVPDGSSLTVKSVSLKLPVLKKPISG